VNLNFGVLSPVFVLSPVNNGAVLFQNMTRSFSQNSLAEQSQQHFMALDKFYAFKRILGAQQNCRNRCAEMQQTAQFQP